MTEHKTRKIFFWILASFFLIIAPSIIFYVRGYRFNFNQGIFVYAGSITIKSNPQRVDIFINGKPSSPKKTNLINNSYHIDGISPGEYLLEIKAAGYTDWTKKIIIRSGISTEFWNVVLIKNDYPKTAYPANDLEKFYLAPNREFIAYTQSENDNFSVSLLNIKTNVAENVFSSSEYNFLKSETEIYQENIEWSPQSHKIIIPAEKDGIQNYFIADIKEKTISDIAILAKTKKIKNARWNSERKNSILYMSENDLYRINIDTEEIAVLAKDIAAYDISSAYIYYLRLSDNLIYKAALKDGSLISQITKSSPEQNTTSPYRLIAYDEDRLAILSKNGGLFIFNKGERETYFREISSDINGVQFSDDGKKLLFCNDFEISSYFVRDWNMQPQRQENEIRRITRFAQKIKNVQWSKDYEHIIFTVKNELKIIEIDHRDHKNTHNILVFANDIPTILADFSENKIYFTDQENNRLNLFSINFPESSGIFGN